jgi:hypothetical protein
MRRSRDVLYQVTSQDLSERERRPGSGVSRHASEQGRCKADFFNIALGLFVQVDAEKHPQEAQQVHLQGDAER